MKDEILKILKETRPEFQFEENVNFIESGYLDSFDVITIVSDLEIKFDVKINGSLILPENFSSVNLIYNLILSSKNAS
jgi:acyl carrier protein